MSQVDVYKETISIVAGDIYGCSGCADGKTTAAMFNVPADILVLPTGEIIVADSQNHVLRKVDLDGNVSTFAGRYTEPQLLGSPSSILSIPSGYLVGDMTESKVHLVDPVTGEVTGYTDLSSESVECPSSLLQTPEGLLVSDNMANVLWIVQLSGELVLFAGSRAGGYAEGDRLSALFNSPQCITQFGDCLLVSDSGNSCLRLIDPQGKTSLYAGSPGNADHRDGYRLHALFVDPDKTLVLPSGDIAISDMNGNRVRLLNIYGFVSTLAGNGSLGYREGPLKFSMFCFPCGLGYRASPTPHVLVADSENHCIRSIPYRPSPFFPRTPASDPKFSVMDLLEEGHKQDIGYVLLECFGRQWSLHEKFIEQRFPALLEVDVTQTIEGSGAKFESLTTLLEWIHTDYLRCHDDFRAIFDLAKLVNDLWSTWIFRTDSPKLNHASWATPTYTSVKPLLVLLQLNLQCHLRLLIMAAKHGTETPISTASSSMSASYVPANSSSTTIDPKSQADLEELQTRIQTAKNDASAPFLQLLALSLEQLQSGIEDRSEPFKWTPDEILTPDFIVPFKQPAVSVIFDLPSVFHRDQFTLESLGYFVQKATYPCSFEDCKRTNIACEAGESIPPFVIWTKLRQGNERVCLLVDEHILAARWPYFRKAMDFGGVELATREMDLGEYLDAVDLPHLLFYLHTGQIASVMPKYPTQSRLLEHAALFGFIDEHWQPQEGFEVLLDHLLTSELNASPHKHAIPGFVRSKQIGTPFHRQSALSSVCNQFENITSSSAAAEQIATLEEQDYKEILLTMFGKRNLLNPKP